MSKQGSDAWRTVTSRPAESMKPAGELRRSHGSPRATTGVFRHRRPSSSARRLNDDMRFRASPVGTASPVRSSTNERSSAVGSSRSIQMTDAGNAPDGVDRTEPASSRWTVITIRPP